MYGVNAKDPDFLKTILQLAIDANTVRKFKPKSTLTFKNGKLFVRSSPEAVLGLRKRGHISEKEEINEIGITPDQVQSFSYNTAFGVIFSVFHKDLSGQYEWQLIKKMMRKQLRERSSTGCPQSQILL